MASFGDLSTCEAARGYGPSVTTFAFVHGAWHDGSCFATVVAELERAGHRGVAPDLPCDDPAATFTDYAGVLDGALGEVEDALVVVGHSLGGLTAPLLTLRRPVRALVYVCALLPAPGTSFRAQLKEEPGILLPDYRPGVVTDDLGRSVWVREDVAREVLYADCDPATASAAYAALRPQADAGHREPCPLDSQPAVPTTSIVCAEDRVVDPEWSRRAAGERLGIEVVELPGGHSPFLSRPDELARLLLQAGG